jgi:hypothetical protein
MFSEASSGLLANPPALAITGKGASARTVRQLAARLAA